MDIDMMKVTIEPFLKLELYHENLTVLELAIGERKEASYS